MLTVGFEPTTFPLERISGHSLALVGAFFIHLRYVSKFSVYSRVPIVPTIGVEPTPLPTNSGIFPRQETNTLAHSTIKLCKNIGLVRGFEPPMLT